MCGKIKQITHKWIELRGCPFCDEELDLELHVYEDGELPTVAGVYCSTCGAEGPARMSEKEALEAWNVRIGDSDD